MEVNDLITFATVARHAAITRAAIELNTVQSNVTSRIKQLEEEVGVALFERHSRGVVLTSAGQRLLPYASRAVALLQEAATAARDDGVARGRLSIGSMETTVAIRLPEVLAAYHSQHPAVEFEVKTGPTAELVQKVIDNEVDGAFVAGPVDHPLLSVDHAYEENLVLVTSLRLRDPSKLHDDSMPLTALMFRMGCSYRQRLEQFLTQIGRPSFQRLEFGTLEGILGCVSADLGITLLPRSVVEKSALGEKLAMHDVPPDIAQTPTLFIRRKGAHESTAMRLFRTCFSSAPQVCTAVDRPIQAQSMFA
ncbi:LysR family transcriptional regulator [Halotalea alkalilenta]|uniref:LysR family transcriptional regulator n=1 Tax=Halotalea alkalilenta TaxID=376489 RepID=UPI0009EDE3A3|nr:LysR family transcriptional regulator [Halotalea alkalilenta]